MKIGKGAIGIVLAVGLFTVTGCGGDGNEPGGEPGAMASESVAGPETTAQESMPPSSSPAESKSTSDEKVVITVEDFQYDIPESVSPGATITVVNKDSVPHTVTSEEEGIFDAVFEGGETVTFTAPEEPGEYPFFCVYHPNMTGTLVVK